MVICPWPGLVQLGDLGSGSSVPSEIPGILGNDLECAQGEIAGPLAFLSHSLQIVSRRISNNLGDARESGLFLETSSDGFLGQIEIDGDGIDRL